MVLKSKQARAVFKADAERTRQFMVQFMNHEREGMDWQDAHMILGLMNILEEYIESEEAEA